MQYHRTNLGGIARAVDAAMVDAACRWPSTRGAPSRTTPPGAVCGGGRSGDLERGKADCPQRRSRPGRECYCWAHRCRRSPTPALEVPMQLTKSLRRCPRACWWPSPWRYDSYLVDSASSHMLVSKIKPCMSKYKQLYRETANGSLNQLSFI